MYKRQNLRSRKEKGQSAANLGSEQTRTGIAVQAAKAEVSDLQSQLRAAKDPSDIAELEKALQQAEEALEDRIADEQVVLDKMKDRKAKLSKRGVDQKWAKVNQRAIQTNQKVDRGDMKTTEDESTKSGGKATFNPYARRKVKPKILWEVGQKDDEQGDGGKDAETPGDEGRTDSTPNLVQEHQDKTALNDYALDEEVTLQSSFLHGISGLGTKRVIKRVRKGLSISEYLKRKADGTL